MRSSSSPAPSRALPSAEARLPGLDALRGVAALMVVAFHYTTRFQDVYGHTAPTAWALPDGQLGVYLFFMVSGFVIFMTLDRIRHTADFAVSRLSRLYPAYWTAAALTLTVEWVWHTLGKTLSPLQALANLLMFHGYFGVPHIDGVYWTLEIELFFYAWMLLLWLVGGLARPLTVFSLWLAASVAAVAGVGWGLPRWPWFVQQLLILPYVPHFILGMVVYLLRRGHGERALAHGTVMAAALAVIGLNAGLQQLAWTLGFLALVGLALGPWGERLGRTGLAWVGAVSYPLYLLHENLGFTLLIHLERGAGLPPDLAVAITVAAALAAAAALHHAVEMPVMHAIRRWYRARPPMPAPDRRTRWRHAAILSAALALLAVGSVVAHRWG